MEYRFLYLSFFALLLAVAACSSPAATGEKQEPSAEESITPTPPVRDLNLDAGLVPTDREMVNAFRWTDQLGENWLVLSELPAYEQGVDLRQTDFSAVRYVKSEDDWSTHWEYTAHLDSCFCDCRIDVVEDQLLIEDIDRDGVMDISFFLYLNDLCDVSPMPTRLVIHDGAETGEVDGFSMPYWMPGIDFPEPQRSASFQELGATFSMHAKSRFFELLQAQEAAAAE